MGLNLEPIVSPALAAALAKFRPFLQADDVERSEAIEHADSQTLVTMAVAVRPLYPEINQVLDRLVAEQHPLPEDLELLEEDLNSLAQAAMEAELELDGRPGRVDE